jgi:stress response protein SCP2
LFERKNSSTILMESFSHEEFIRASRMEGKSIRVTEEDVKRMNSRDRAGDNKMTMQSRWQETLEREAAERELAVRKQRKQAQSELDKIQRRNLVEPPPHNKSMVADPDCNSNSEQLSIDGNSLVTQTAANCSEVKVISQDEKSQELHVENISGAAQSLEIASSSSKIFSEHATDIRIEMWWQGNVDLDLSCVLIDQNNRRCGVFFFGETEPHRAFNHSGDMLSGPGPAGASEKISVMLHRVPEEVKYVYFVMTAFSANSCADVEKLLVRVVDGQDSKTLLGDAKTLAQKTRAALLCRLQRESPSAFSMTVLETTFDHGDTVLSLTREIELHAASVTP